MTAHATPAGLRTLALFLAGLAVPAAAIGLGELKVHSWLGEPLDATVALAAEPDARPRPDCFSLGRARAGGLPGIARATFAVERDAAAWRVRIRTRAALGDPALHLRLIASCEGRDAASRDYEILLDPRPAERPAPALRSLPGDTVAALAAAIYPKPGAAREGYARALRAANPAVGALGTGEAIPPGTAIVLPDLRRFSMSLAVAPAAAGKLKPAKKAQRPATADVAKPPAPEGGRFVLRLSAPVVDLSRSRGMDDRTRSQLRERLLVLDADDQVAALLSMRNSLKQLEGRVAELQLKLSALPPPAPVPASPLPPPASPPSAPTRNTVPAGEKSATPEKSAAPAAKPAIAPPPRPTDTPSGADGLPPWLLAVLALLAAAIVAIAWRMPRRTAKPPAAPTAAPPASVLDEADAMMRRGDGGNAEAAPRDHRIVAESDAALATNVSSGDPDALRRRYIEERFPEIASGTIVPGDPDSVVKAARLFYEDGALARAVELLQFAVEETPAALKPWLALFEIFRLEGLAGEFGELAGRFREHHSTSLYWRKVQFIGRELEPGNPLYRESPIDHLETIGSPARRKAAPVTFDPLAENWLNAPMDFTTDALAASLREGVLADAEVSDSDLVADPMPALKNVEMFNVA